MNEHYFVVLEDQYLAHHGIKGQKWGVRRYQNPDGSLTELGRQRYMKSKYGMSLASGIYRGSKNDIISERVYTHTDENGNDWWTDAVELRDDRINNDYLDDPSTAFPSQYTKVNPMYGKQTGTTNNCTKCAAAMILAKKGYDFEAGRAWTGMTNAFDSWFSNSKKSICDNSMQASSQIVGSKNGSYGTIDFRNILNPKSGHVINWEHNADGTFSLYDSQNGTSFTSDTFSDCMEQYNDSLNGMFNLNSTINVYDLTDAMPNWGMMSEDAVVRFNSEDYSRNRLYDREYREMYRDL